ncbi:MAG: carbamoyltransferase N-terminal domain-containing protein [Candidatus Levyibacteriota bacterium]
MYILGISCFYHESAACLIKNGKVLAASAEERFTRKKHDSDFPKVAIDFCLKKAGIKNKDLDFVVFYEKPFWKFQRILQSILQNYPFTSRLFTKAMNNWLVEKLWVRSIIAGKLDIQNKKILFVPHHLSHAAASFYPSGFTNAAIMTVDAVGEWTTTAYGKGNGNKITIEKEIRFPHSLGLLYSVFTAFLGFEVNDGEYKVMGMAPYGKPLYLDKIKKMIRVFPDGSYQLNMNYFSFHKSADKSYTSKFVELLGKPRPRDLYFFTKDSGFPSYFGHKPKNYNELAKLNQHYADVAASIQTFTEELLLLMANKLYEKTKLDNLCLGGGVGLNSVANGLLLKKSPFKRIFVQPASGDDGGALGAALYAYHMIFNGKQKFAQDNSYFGIEFNENEIEEILKKEKVKYKKILSENKLVDYISDQLVKKKVIGFFHGKAEWGPRALGARSILANPTSEEMKDIVNVRIKFREPYRPFAPVVLAKKARDYFELGKKDHKYLTNFMLGVFPVKKSMQKVIPAVTHIDKTARPQIITQKQNSRYYNIIKSFGDKTGVYVLMNTSFNLKGEPIVNSPQNALNTFRKSGLDILVLENFVILKENIL